MPPPEPPPDRLRRHQRALADFAAEALGAPDLDPLLTRTCVLAAEAMETPRAVLFELRGDRLVARAGTGWPAGLVDTLSLPAPRNLAGGPSPATARAEGSPVLPDALRRAGIAALAEAPILRPDGRVWGVLQVCDTAPRTLAPDAPVLRIACSILGQAVARLTRDPGPPSAEERFRMTVEAETDQAIFATDAEGRITDWLPGAEAVYGWSAAEARGRPADILFTPADRAAGRPAQELEKARRTGRADDTRDHLRKDGALVFIEGVTRALHDPAGRVTGFVKIGRDRTARRDADRRLRTLLEGIPQLVWRAAGRGRWTWASPQWLAYAGQTRGEARGMGWLEAVHPEDRDALRAAWAEAEVRGGLDIDLRIRRRADGAYLWHRTRARPVLDGPIQDGAGGIVEWLGTSTEIQEMRALQDRQRAMVAELQHRTRNLIGVIGSIAAQTMAETGPTPAFLESLNRRLAALSRVQGMLSRAEERPITLRALLESELGAAIAGPLPPGMLEGPELRLRRTHVQMLALALHELATDARRAGALSGAGGALRVRWREERAPSGARLHLDWRETGAPPPGPGEGARAGAEGGYARLLVERALPYSLGAITRYRRDAGGLACTIALPLERGPPGRDAG